MADRWTTTVVTFLGEGNKAQVTAVYDPPGGGPVFTHQALIDPNDAQEQQDFVTDAVAAVTLWNNQRSLDDATAGVLDSMLEAAYP